MNQTYFRYFWIFVWKRNEQSFPCGTFACHKRKYRRQKKDSKTKSGCQVNHHFPMGIKHTACSNIPPLWCWGQIALHAGDRTKAFMGRLTWQDLNQEMNRLMISPKTPQTNQSIWISVMWLRAEQKWLGQGQFRWSEVQVCCRSRPGASFPNLLWRVQNFWFPAGKMPAKLLGPDVWDGQVRTFEEIR